MRQIRLPYVHIVHYDIEFNDEGIRKGKSRGKADVKPKLDSVIEESEIKQLIREACDRRTSLDRLIQIRGRLTQLRRQMRAVKSCLA